MDEVVLSVTAFGGAIFAAGLAFGGLVAYLILPGERRARQLQTELEQVRKETMEYKGSVSRHFHRTAELVSGLTSSYKAVYDHLSSGAQELAETPDGAHALAFADPKLLVEQASSSRSPLSASGATKAGDVDATDTVGEERVEACVDDGPGASGEVKAA